MEMMQRRRSEFPTGRIYADFGSYDVTFEANAQ
jgi:hypothetical protein